MPRKIAAGNWKMNGSRAALNMLAELPDIPVAQGPDVVICPPMTLIAAAVERATGTRIAIGAQDCHAAASGAFTGDTAAEMIAEAGASHVIVGHSERRAAYGETDESVATKTQAAWRAGLTAIICLGESLAERENGDTLSVVARQLAASIPSGVTATNTVIAYEPIWAIGTGKVPSIAQIAEVHDAMRAQLIARFGQEIGAAIPLLYGGSVKASNAAAIFEIKNVDGALVGGASLKALDFVPIIEALAQS